MKTLLTIILMLLLLALPACQSPVSDMPPSESLAGTSAPPESVSPSESVPPTEPPAEETDAPADPDFFPDFLLEFDFDRADWLDVNEERDYRICLMEESEQKVLPLLLEMGSWTVAEDIPAMGIEPAYILYDHAHNSLVVTPWENDTCLIIAADREAEGDVYRYFAPAHVLDRFNDFVSGLTPLPGTVSTSEELYYDLFRQDRGLVPLAAMSTPNQSSFYDDQLSAYAVSALGDSYDWENGNTIEEYDAVTLRHFGRRISNHNNSMTYYAPETGTIHATGWSFHSGLYPVLVEESVDESGVVTALFRCYSLSDSDWDSGAIEKQKLNHIKEYLLTGNDEGFPEPTMLKVVFEVRFDVPTQTSYLFYHSLMFRTEGDSALHPLPECLPKQLTYTSGAGAWGTTITLNRDGTFSGVYRDSDLGVTGDDHPNGTVYISVFSGTFSDIEAIDACTYSMTLDSLIVNTAGEWIEDGKLYIASDPHGLTEGGKFILCTADSPQSAFFDHYLYLLADPDDTCPVPYWGLFNEDTGAGFFGR